MSLPNHVGIILDGNSRWAQNNNVSLYEGHRAGSDNAAKILEECVNKNIKHLSMFVFSYENWNRPSDEVNHLMGLLDEFANSELNKLSELNVQFKIVGRLDNLKPSLLKLLESAVENTKNNNGLILYLMVSYGGRQEIVDAAKKLVQNYSKKDEIDVDTFQKFLYQPDMPYIDLLIRTGNVSRISNYMLWQSAYAELYFSEKMWPDFDENDLEKAFKEYKNSNRTFGKRN